MLDPAEPSHFALGYLPLFREEGQARPECGFEGAPFFQLFLVHAATKNREIRRKKNWGKRKLARDL
jgi:hypothetical protein